MKTKSTHFFHYSHPSPSPLGVSIYIDESGDLGFPRGSDYFVFGAVIVKNEEDELDCKTHTRRARKKILDSYHFEELKNSKLRDDCRKIVIHEIIKGSYDFAYVLLRKNEVHEHLRNTRGLYNWLAAKLVEEIIIEYGFKADVNVIIDKSLNGIQQSQFNQTLLIRNFDRFNHLRDLEVRIFHCDSKTECGIQIADIVAGCVYQHYTRFTCDPSPDENYFPRICEKTKVALDFFKGRRK